MGAFGVCDPVLVALQHTALLEACAAGCAPEHLPRAMPACQRVHRRGNASRCIDVLALVKKCDAARAWCGD